MVAGLDGFPSIPMKKPSPGIIQIDKAEENITHCPFQAEPPNRQLELLQA
jgi:hypothetical protein